MAGSDGVKEAATSPKSEPASPRSGGTKGSKSPRDSPGAANVAPNTTQSPSNPATIPEGQMFEPETQAVLEAGGTDDEDEDEDEFQPSDLDAESLRSDTTSIGSNVVLNSFENGRRYHRYMHARYPIPNDETEQDREDMLHAMMLEVTDGRLFFAPVGEYPQKIIDLGTGSGIWAIDVGDQYPSAEVLGVDMSPIQPIWTPANVRFVADDLREPWLNGEGWDLVHLRHMIPILEDPVAILSDAFKHIKPGGWIELQDLDGQVSCDDGTLPPDWPLVKFTNLMVEAFATYDGNVHAAVFARQYLEAAGFVNIRHTTRKLPYGTWARDKTMRLVGEYYRISCEQFFPVVGAMHLPRLGWSPVEMEVLFAQCRNAMKDPKVHAYGVMHFWSGQKPMEAE